MGYATEASKAIIQWAYKNVGARDFFACHANANEASGNVIKNADFHLKNMGNIQDMMEVRFLKKCSDMRWKY